MQDITHLAFMRVLARRSAPDWFVTEYFRVHPNSKPERHIVRAITGNDTGKPVFAQLIGDDLPSLVRTTRALERFPIAGIDINLGCPAPIVCRKNAGGGLLRRPGELRVLLDGLRAAIPGRFTAKTRIGYASPDEFPDLLECFAGVGLDGLTIHARTVKQCYKGPVDTPSVALAARVMPCPVIANGNIVDAATALAYHRLTGAAGLMVGRGAIRNPWIFSQVDAAFAGSAGPRPSHLDLLEYINELYDEVAAETAAFCPKGHVQRMKRTVVYICHGVGGGFEHALRRCVTPDEFHAICRDQLASPEPLPVLPPDGSPLFSGFGGLLE